MCIIVLLLFWGGGGTGTGECIHMCLLVVTFHQGFLGRFFHPRSGGMFVGVQDLGYISEGFGQLQQLRAADGRGPPAAM